MKEENNRALNHLEELDLAKLYRELRKTRVISMISSILMVLVLVGGGFFFHELRLTREQTKPLIEQISALNMEELNLTLEEVNDTLESVDWEQVAQVLGGLDVDALNTAIENLDTAELTEALKNLNNAVDTLGQMGNSLKQILPFFN